MPNSQLRARLPRLSKSNTSLRDSKADRNGTSKQDSAIESSEPTRLMRDLQLNSLISPISENRVKVLTAVDKFEVARRLPKTYSKTYHVRRHIAHQQRRLNLSPQFMSVGRGAEGEKKRPWQVSYVKQASGGQCLKYGSTYLEHSLPGAEKFYTKTWSEGKIPPFDPISRWAQATDGEQLKKFMCEQIIVESGCQVDQVIGVTSPEMMRHVKETADLESTMGTDRFGATDQTDLGSVLTQDLEGTQDIM